MRNNVISRYRDIVFQKLNENKGKNIFRIVKILVIFFT